MYRLLYDRKVFKELDKLSNTDAARVQNAMNSLKENPLPHGNKKLSGVSGLYRLRQGNYRIIYTVNHSHKTVHVLSVGDRKDIYR